jgi:hypothetical protein
MFISKWNGLVSLPNPNPKKRAFSSTTIYFILYQGCLSVMQSKEAGIFCGHQIFLWKKLYFGQKCDD